MNELSELENVLGDLDRFPSDRMERYDSYYVFSNFKRDRTRFNDYDYLGSYIGRLYSRYFGPMSSVYDDRNHLSV